VKEAGNAIQIIPLRNMVLVELEQDIAGTPLPVIGGLVVIVSPRAVQKARIVACGPEVRDLQPGYLVLANTSAGHRINGQLLVPAHAILGTL